MSLIIYATDISSGEIMGYLSYSQVNIIIQNPLSVHLNPALPGNISTEYLWMTINISSDIFYISTADDLRWTMVGDSFPRLTTNGTAFQATNPNFNDSQITYYTKIYSTSLLIQGTDQYVGIQNNELVVVDQNTIQFNFMMYIGDMYTPNYLVNPFCNNLTSNMGVYWNYTYCIENLEMATYFPSPPTTTNNIPVYSSSDTIPSNICTYVTYIQDSNTCYSNFQGITIVDCNFQTQYLLTINTSGSYPDCTPGIPCLSIQADDSSQTQYVNITNATQNYLLVQGQVPFLQSLTPEYNLFNFYMAPGANTNLSLSSQVNFDGVKLQDSQNGVYTSYNSSSGSTIKCIGQE